MNISNKIDEAVKFIRTKTKDKFEIGIILGTGLGGLVKDIKISLEIDYSEIPNFPVSTVESHQGKLIFGKLSGKNIVALQGRFHYYEGYSQLKVTFPIFVLKKLGVKHLIVSNACGALNPAYRKTDLMIITSHINLHFANPLMGLKIKPKEESRRFYSKYLTDLAKETALSNGIKIQQGSYASAQGPSLETRAEYRAFRKFSGDVVGMSTIPEVIVAKKLGIETLGISIITDEGFPDTVSVAILEHILKAAAIAEPKMTLLIKGKRCIYILENPLR